MTLSSQSRIIQITLVINPKRKAVNRLKTQIADDIKKFFSDFGLPKNLFARLASSYFIVAVVQMLFARFHKTDPIKDWKTFVNAVSLPSVILWTAIVFLWLTVIYRLVSRRLREFDSAALIFSSVTFSLCLVFGSGSFYVGAAAAIVCAVLAHYSLERAGKGSLERLPKIPAAVIVFTLSAGVILFVSAATIANHKCFGTACFDMGIFVQTFHSLKENLTAAVTCERGELMSHFQVHGSYIFYLFLPIYALFPKPETLLAAQAFFAAAGVLPLYLIVKRRGFKGIPLVSCCLIYVFCAGVIMPCFYQFHENAFLPTLLMWLLCAADSANIPLLYIMSALTCIVKEDAPLYVICIGLFFAVDCESWKKKKHGIIAALLSSIYFVIVMRWLTSFGDGGYMTSTRFGILMADPDGGLAGIIRSAIADPGYLVSLLLSEKTLLFFIETMLPLLFLPFMTAKLYRFLLMIPYIIMNLIIGSGYGYAANIGFQYIFGPACLLIYLSIRNTEDMGMERRNKILIIAAIVTVITTVSMASVKLSYITRYNARRDYYNSADECIQSVPKDACVLANAFLLPHAADRDCIYELKEDVFTEDGLEIKEFDKYDFCILSTHDPMTEKITPFLQETGWEVYATSDEGFVVIYVSPGYRGGN